MESSPSPPHGSPRQDAGSATAARAQSSDWEGGLSASSLAVGMIFLLVAVFALVRLHHASTTERSSAAAAPKIQLLLEGESWQEGLAKGLSEALAQSLVPGAGAAASAPVDSAVGTPWATLSAAGQSPLEAILEGSVERHGHRLLVTARLVEPLSHRPFWSGRLDGSACDLEELGRRLAATVGGEMRRAAGAAPAPTLPAAVG